MTGDQVMRAQKTLLIALILLVAIASTLSVIALSAGSKVTVLTVSKTTMYIYEKYWVFANIYNTATGQQYPVTVNITIANQYEVVFHGVYTGNPLNVTLTAPSTPGKYTMYIYLVSKTAGVSTSKTYTLEILYPQPQIDVDALWKHYTAVKISMPYPYNMAGALVINGTNIPVTLHNGRATINTTGLSAPTQAYFLFAGRKNYFNITPRTPAIALYGIPSAVEAGRNFSFIPELQPYTETSIKPLITIYSENGTLVYNGTVPLYRRTSLSINHVGNYTVLASYSPWPGKTVYTTYRLVVTPTQLQLVGGVYRLDNWTYSVAYMVRSDVYWLPVHVAIQIDNTTITETVYPPAIIINKTVRLNPGNHTIAVVAVQAGHPVCDTHVVDVPKHYYRLPPPPPYIYAGDRISEYIHSSDIHYSVSILGDRAVVYLYFPGNSTYYPAETTWVVPIVYPEITVNNGTAIIARVPANTEIIVMKNDRIVYSVKAETVMDNMTIHVPLKCTIEIIHGWYHKVVVYRDNYPLATIAVLSTAYTGVPTTPLYQSQYIVRAYIDSKPYIPGTSYVFKTPGTHYITVVTPVGTYTYTVYVKPYAPLVICVMNPDGSYTVTAPNITVYLVLSSGGLVTVRGVTTIYTGGEAIVYAYTEYGAAKLVVIKKTTQ